MADRIISIKIPDAKVDTAWRGFLAMTYNAHRGKGARAMKPDEFNPLAVQRKQQQPVEAEDISVLKRTFVDR